MYLGAWATVDTQALEASGGGSSLGGGAAGKAPGGKAGPVTGGPAPGPRTGHCVLIASSFLTPK